MYIVEIIKFNTLFLIKLIYNFKNRIRSIYFALINKIRNKLNQIKRKYQILKDINNSIITSTQGEYDNVIKYFYEEYINNNYEKIYPDLTKDLDKKSIACVDKILSDVKKISSSINKELGIYSKKELTLIKKLRRHSFLCIKNINKNCFEYKQYKLPIRHFEESVFYYKHNIDELNKEKFKNKDIIDAGGFIGDSAIVLSQYTNGTIYSFEPTSTNYAFMLNTLELNPKCKNIKAINMGLGSKKEEQKINVSGSCSSVNMVFNNTEESEIIKMTTLDDFVREKKLNNIGLIKVDIEGFEQEFLKGAIETIKNQKPALLLSIYHNAGDFFKIKLIIESFNLGYRFKIVKPVFGNILIETLLICEVC